MANSDKNIRITPNKNTISYPKIVFTGQTNAPITLNILDDNSLSFEGTSGQLFSITNNISSGTIFSVSDISGIPSLRINADGTVGIAEFSGNVGIGLTNPQYKLHVNGTFGVTGAFALLSNTQSTSSTTGALTVVGGLGVSGNANIGTGLGVSGAAALGSTLTVAGAATLSSTLAVTGAANFTAALGVGGAANITGGLGVTGAATLRSTLDISGATTITLSSASAKGLVIKGAVSQSANLLEFQNSSSTILASIDPNGIFALANTTNSTSTTTGALTVAGGVGIGGSVNIGGRVGVGTSVLTGQVNIATASASTPGLIVRGSTSQTADYAQFFTSTGSTSITITKDAEIKFPLAQDVKLYAENYSTVGIIKSSGNFMAMGGYLAAYGAGNTESYLYPTGLTVYGALNWSTYGSGTGIRWATNNFVRIQPTGTSVTPLVIYPQSTFATGNLFELNKLN